MYVYFVTISYNLYLMACIDTLFNFDKLNKWKTPLVRGLVQTYKSQFSKCGSPTPLLPVLPYIFALQFCLINDQKVSSQINLTWVLSQVKPRVLWFDLAWLGLTQAKSIQVSQAKPVGAEVWLVRIGSFKGVGVDN
jgi:hypothetical protein